MILLFRFFSEFFLSLNEFQEFRMNKSLILETNKISFSLTKKDLLGKLILVLRCCNLYMYLDYYYKV